MRHKIICLHKIFRGSRLLAMALVYSLPSFATAENSTALSTFRTYFNLPSAANADAVMSQLPAAGTPLDASEAGDLISMVLWQLESRDPAAVRLAIRLLENLKETGSPQEVIYESLGHLIRIDPSLFANEMQTAPEPVVTRVLEWSGLVYVDSDKGPCFEAEKRIEALATVRTPALAKFIEKSNHILKSVIKEECKTGEQ